MNSDAEEILAIERGAFERWAKGDLEGFLEASDPEVDYFDPFVGARLEGLAALRALYEPLQGTFTVDRWEMVNPRVLVAGDMGVLTFNFTDQIKGKTARWNTTEVYRRTNGQWKIIHTHWALTQPQPADTQAAAT
ncbi:MAG: nuclear transport factor 2 family protein [Bryobacteraceae bacterium]